MASNQEGDNRVAQSEEVWLHSINLTDTVPADEAPDAKVNEPDPPHPDMIDPDMTTPVMRDPENDIDADEEIDRDENIDPALDPDIPDPGKHARG